MRRFVSVPDIKKSAIKDVPECFLLSIIEIAKSPIAFVIRCSGLLCTNIEETSFQ
jgi:hypothetical protein